MKLILSKKAVQNLQLTSLIVFWIAAIIGILTCVWYFIHPFVAGFLAAIVIVAALVWTALIRNLRIG